MLRATVNLHGHRNEAVAFLLPIPLSGIAPQSRTNTGLDLGQRHLSGVLNLLLGPPATRVRRMTTVWAENFFVPDLLFPVFAQDLELEQAFFRRTFPIEISLTVVIDRNGDVRLSVKLSQSPDSLFEHAALRLTSPLGRSIPPLKYQFALPGCSRRQQIRHCRHEYAVVLVEPVDPFALVVSEHLRHRLSNTIVGAASPWSYPYLNAKILLSHLLKVAKSNFQRTMWRNAFIMFGGI